MDKRMCLSEKVSMENNSANQDSNGEKFVHKVASSGLVLKFKVDKYGTPPPKHTISHQEVMMSGGKQNVMEVLDNSEANSSTNAIHLLEQSEISAAEGTRSNKISLFDKAKVAPPDEIDNTAAMVELPVMAHKCNECGKRFQEISSLHGHKGVHRREEYKRKRMMLEQQQPIIVDASHVVSSQKTHETNKKDDIKNIRFAAHSLDMLSMEFKRHRPDDLSASMICTNKHISAGEETDEMREAAEILVTLAQSFRKDSTMHVASSSSTIGKRFVCSTCKKVFSSYHGLGGHMSIHNKPTKNSLLEDGSTGSSGVGREKSIWKYVCDKCNMKFPTGQILGGHKRGHWWAEHYERMALLGLGDRNVKPRLPILLPHHEAERSGLPVVPTDENIQPAGTGLVAAAHTVPLACDGVQKSHQAMSPGNEIELPVPSGVSDEDVA